MNDLVEWKPVVGFGGIYEVSSWGIVRRQLSAYSAKWRNKPYRILKTRPNRYGYHRVVLYRDGKGYARGVSRLVLESFVGPPPEDRPFALHSDGDRNHNWVENLRWGSQSENTLDAVAHGTHPETRKTHCPEGHPYDKGNTYYAPATGHRKCRACAREKWGGDLIAEWTEKNS